MPAKANNGGIRYDRLRKIISSKDSVVHFIGVGGVSMYSLAKMTLSLGASVTGSDLVDSERTRALSDAGAIIYKGHSAYNVISAALVVYSSAVGENNPELIGARSRSIPTVSRAEYMGALMIGYKKRIGVSGTHGKSTTVAMLDSIFTAAMCEPSVLSGADLQSGEPYKEGRDALLLYEACEYKDSFLKFNPTISVALNLEYDHPDYFKSLKTLKASFARALGRAPLTVLNGDDENLLSVAFRLKNKVVTFGQGERVDYRYSITSFLEHGYEFSVSKFNTEIGRFRLFVPGIYNVTNAVAAVVTAIEYGINVDVIREGIAAFSGIGRRLEYIGERYGRKIYYDYAHHPTAIRCAINALKLETGDLITVVFKPHTYSRTKSLWDGFIDALSLADYAVITDIYAAREEPIEKVSSERLAMSIGPGAIYSLDEAVCAVVDRQTHGAIVLMGAGDFGRIKRDLLST
ncbi:MAG: UDP-N-acetylmuramate--L-alanine ligase [Clostridia bacterium]|nr:UDP-N-acetylmuramate--L-alanine ligase [Clostridia bacterium]